MPYSLSWYPQGQVGYFTSNMTWRSLGNWKKKLTYTYKYTQNSWKNNDYEIFPVRKSIICIKYYAESFFLPHAQAKDKTILVDLLRRIEIDIWDEFVTKYLIR